MLYTFTQAFSFSALFVHSFNLDFKTCGGRDLSSAYLKDQ